MIPLHHGGRRALGTVTLLGGLAVLAVTLTGCAAHGGAPTGAPSGSGAGTAVLSADAVRGQPAPAGAQLDAVSCAPGGRCWAVGQSGGGAVVAATADGGRTWQVQLDGTLPPPVGATTTPPPVGATTTPPPAGAVVSSTLDAVSCPDTRHCVAVGDVTQPQLGPVVLTTDDGGRVWAQAPAPSGALDLLGVQCPDHEAAVTAIVGCIVLAGNGSNEFTATATPTSAAGPPGAGSWQVGALLPAGFGDASGLTCPEAGRCLVAGGVATTPGHAGGAIALTTDGGASWRLATLPPDVGMLHSVSCVATSCLAVGTTSTVTSGVAPGHGVVLASSDGATFTLRPAPASLDDGDGVSCAEPGVCAAVGTTFTPTIPATPEPAVVTTGDLGVGFASPPRQYVPSPLASVACASPGDCVAAGGGVLARFPLPAGRPPGRTRAATSGTRPVLRGAAPPA